MTSIRESITELDRYHEVRQLTLDSYIASIRSSAQYAVELDDALTGQYRKNMEALAAETAAGDSATLLESRATFRGLLRDYRDKAAAFIAGLKAELANSADALSEILSSFAQGDGDHEVCMRGSVRRLREIADSPQCASVRARLGEVTDSIEQSIEQMRKNHELTVSQFQVEIHMLHKRIDELEKAATIDSLSKFFNRAEMEGRIRSAQGQWFALLLMRVGGLLIAESRYDSAVASELAGAFGKRLRNSLPHDAVIGRWGGEEFVAMVNVPKPDAITAAKWVSENLSGPYSCLKQGKTVRPSLQVSVAVADSEASEPAERTLLRVREFFKT